MQMLDFVIIFPAPAGRILFCFKMYYIIMPPFLMFRLRISCKMTRAALLFYSF